MNAWSPVTTITDYDEYMFEVMRLISDLKIKILGEKKTKIFNEIINLQNALFDINDDFYYHC